jgi:cardiolipin synthase A/B
MSAKKIKGSNRFSVNNEVKLVRSGGGYFMLMEELIDRARYSIHLQTYIFKDDETGNRILDALSRAARRGVETYLIADGYASRTLSPATVNLLTGAGVHFRFFEPLFKSDHFYFGRRMHHKALVVDARYALIGGINIANHYNDIKGDVPWLDYALYVEGEAATRIYEICKGIWGKHIGNVGSTEVVKASIPQKDWCSVRVRENDWLKGKHQVWRSYFELFNNARESITIVCSYFLPGRVLRKRLAKAAQRGVKVKVILAGPSDVMLAKYAERYLYHWMWRNRIEIYEYQPSVLHAKMAIADGKWLVLGSYNVNNISTYASIELNLEVRSRKLAAAVNEELKLVLRDCIRIAPESILTPGKLIKNFFQKLSFEVVRMLLKLFTFYFKPKH